MIKYLAKNEKPLKILINTISVRTKIKYLEISK